jgi:hypothetical protein
VAVERRWIKRLREGLVANLPKLTGVRVRNVSDDVASIVGVDAGECLVLFSWDFVFHKQCEVELATLWPACEQIDREMSFHVLPELSAKTPESEWPATKWWCKTNH